MDTKHLLIQLPRTFTFMEAPAHELIEVWTNPYYLVSPKFSQAGLPHPIHLVFKNTP